MNKYSETVLPKGQIAILEILYKYRFGSRQLIAKSLDVLAGSSLHVKLEGMRSRGYIDKYFDSSYKLQNIPAAYYLLPKGFRALQALPEYDHITSKVIKASYSNKRASQSFIQHTLTIYKLTQILRSHYPELRVLTARDMSRYSYFPNKLPDTFLSLPQSNQLQPGRFFMHLVPNEALGRDIGHILKAHGEYFEAGWPAMDSAAPSLLLIAHSKPQERRLQRQALAVSNRYDIDILVYSTTVEAIIKQAESNSPIWTDLLSTEKQLSFTALL